MFGNSPRIESSQVGAHPRLLDVVRRHHAHPSRAPLHAPTQAQFALWRADYTDDTPGRPLLLDLGCGNGESSLQLGELHPNADVVGVDQSAQRLAKRAAVGYARFENVVLLRAEAATFLRLLAASGVHIDTLYLLYPNPWPKPEHLQRRWHGHPVLPTLLGIARNIVLRTNWQTYADEFTLAAQTCGRTATQSILASDSPVMTPFEAKYLASGHQRHEVCVS